MKIKIGTRGSKLALIQTNLVADALKAKGAEVELIEISTVGDRKQGTVQASKSDKRDWIHDLEIAVLDGSIDLAVHSGKDVPAEIAEETILLPVLKRANPFDAFIGQLHSESGKRLKFSEVPQGATIGTASLRRQAQIKRVRPDLTLVEHRGNVPTRLQKLEDSEILSGIVLACAGLERLGYDELGYEEFDSEIMLPAINQGTLCIQCRRDKKDLVGTLRSIGDSSGLAAFEAERGCVSKLEADCDSAVSIFATVQEDMVELKARVLVPDGTQCIEVSEKGKASEAFKVGEVVGQKLIDSGANELLEESRKIRKARL